MYGVLRRYEEQSGPDYQDRLFLSFDQMFPREENTVLGQIHDYWLSRRKAGRDLPTVDSFRPREALPREHSRAISSVDVTTDDPLNFTFVSHPQYTKGYFDLSGRRLGDHPSKMNVKACAADYVYCVATRTPIYHEIYQTIGSVSRRYVRLALPVADLEGRVVDICYAIRMLPEIRSCFAGIACGDPSST